MQIGGAISTGWSAVYANAPGLAAATVRNVGRFGRRNPIGAFWGLVLIFIAVVALTAPLIVPHDPISDLDFNYLRCPPTWLEGTKNIGSLVIKCENPGSWWTYLFGTDHTGRDIFSRIIQGTRTTLQIALIATIVGDALGAMFGVASGYLGGKLDLIGQRILEMLMSFPTLILAMILVVGLGPGVYTVIIAIAATRVPFAVRVVRSVVMSVKENVYVDAARAIGASDLRIMVQHIAPQCVASWMVLVTAHLGIVIILEATLGFLGLGVPPPTPTWGNMLGEAGANPLTIKWWMVVFPGVAITVTVLAFNLFGDSIRDALDPKMRGARAEN